jgi:hypothetical protein
MLEAGAWTPWRDARTMISLSAPCSFWHEFTQENSVRCSAIPAPWQATEHCPVTALEFSALEDFPAAGELYTVYRSLAKCCSLALLFPSWPVPFHVDSIPNPNFPSECLTRTLCVLRSLTLLSLVATDWDLGLWMTESVSPRQLHRSLFLAASSLAASCSKPYVFRTLSFSSYCTHRHSV